MSIQPTTVNILVKILPRGESAGLLLPDGDKRWKEATLRAEIVAVGPFVNEVAPGEIIVMEGAAGKWIDKDLTPDPAEIYRMITSNDILLVEEQEVAV